MIAYLNMNARVRLGNVELDRVSSFEISNSVLGLSNTAKVVVAKHYHFDDAKSILEQFKVGDPAVITAGYNDDLQTEFTGFISEIDSDIPLVISCEDMYPLRQNNWIKSYPAGTKLKKILTDIIPATAGITEIVCDDVTIGKYQIDNASTFAVLQDLMTNHGLYSSLDKGVLKVGLAYDFGTKSRTHEYVIGANVKKNELKYKRKEDFKIRINAVATSANGKKTKVTVGDKAKDASERSLNFIGPMSEKELKQKAEAVLSKLRFDGYTGSITGFGIPRIRAGDALRVIDRPEKDNEYRDGKYLVEKVDIDYSEAGFSRKNTLSYKIDEKIDEKT